MKTNVTFIDKIGPLGITVDAVLVRGKVQALVVRYTRTKKRVRLSPLAGTYQRLVARAEQEARAS